MDDDPGGVHTRDGIGSDLIGGEQVDLMTLLRKLRDEVLRVDGDTPDGGPAKSRGEVTDKTDSHEGQPNVNPPSRTSVCPVM